MPVNITYRTSHTEAEVASDSFVNKNAPLSNKQIDGNFKSLKVAIESLQDAIGVGSTLAADQVEFSSSNGITASNVQGAIDEVNLLAIGKQAPLISGESIKTINGTSLLGSGDISIIGGSVTGAVINDTSTGTSETFSASEIISRLLNKQQTLVNQTNIKSINGNSLLGTGNIVTATINDSSSGTGETLSAAEIDNRLSSKQDTLVNQTNIKSINGNSLLGTGNISIATASINDSSTGTGETLSASQIISRLSLKEPSIAKSAGYLTSDGTSWTFKNESYATINDTGTGNAVTWSAQKLIQNFTTKQDSLVNQTNIKSINNISLLGTGNISIATASINDSSTGTGETLSASQIISRLSLKEPSIAKSAGYLTSDGTSWTFKNESYGVVNDSATGTTTWTSNKINSELASIASSSVSLTGTQTLSNKTLLSPTLTSYTETIHTITGTDIIATNGSIQTATLTGNVSYAITLGEGQSVTVLINPVTYTVSWTSAISWIGTTASTAPTLTASVMNCITFFKVGDVIYGKFSGRV